MSMRRLLPLALTVPLALACGGGESPTSPGPGSDGAPASVTISPSSATFPALGDTTEFSATVEDQDGTTISGATVSWSSTGAGVVSVDDSGVAVAQANGTAEVVASAEGVADTALVTVDQRADQMSVSPAVDTLAAGDSVQLSASAEDANGNAMPDADVSWSSSDTAVATVDSTGFVRARSDGTVDITAELDGVSGGSDVTVLAGAGPDDAPTVTSVSPSPVPEGGSATVTGSNFASTTGGNTVTVDGVQATVVSATASSLEIDVPLFDCLPARSVTVDVSTAAGSGQISVDLAPDETPVSLAVGEQRTVQDPADFCLQFAETSASERYLIGVQSLSSTVSSLTPVTVTSEAAGGSSASTLSPTRLEREVRVADGGGATPRRSEDLYDHRRAEMERRRWERRHLDPSASLSARGRGPTLQASKLVSGSVKVGDTVSVRVPDARFNDLCSNFVEVGAEVKAIGTRGIFVADTANPSGGFTDTDYQDFSNRMDTDIFGTLTDYFGSPTDLDGNGHVVVLISKEVNRTSPTALGFVFPGDFFPRTTSGGGTSCASSDEGEFYYGKAPDPNGDFGSPYSTDEARLQTPFIMSHELTHVIQQGRRLQANQPIMSSIVAEAQATFGEEIVGHSVTGRTTGQDYGFDVAFNAGGTDEIDWYRDGFLDLLTYYGFVTSTTRVSDAPDACGWWREDPSPCQARPLWYGVGWTFLRWVSDQFGPTYSGGEQGLHRDLIGSGGTGPENVAAVLGESFDELMAQWAASLYVDGRVPGVDARLTLPSWDLFDVEQNTVTTAHLQPLEMDFSDWQGVGDIRASSAGYIAVEQASRPATAVRVRDGTGQVLPADMQIWVVRLQ